MNVLRYALIVLLFGCATAAAAPASDGSIKDLLTITQAQKILDGMRAQFDSLMNNAVQQALRGKTPSAAQQKAIDNMKNRMVAVLQGQLAWEKLEPMYLRLYRESFTEDEIGGMLAFYKTPAGQAVINKMPLLIQKTMTEIQTMSTGLAPQMLSIQKDFMVEIQAADK
jgi:hypothetical protein